MHKFTLPTVLDIYITNVCNLTCENCRSCNNHQFRGHVTYNHDRHWALAQQLDIPTFGILGGEPCLHPDLFDWLQGLRQCWPKSKANVITNGTRLSKVRGLHRQLADLNYDVQVTIHAENLREFVADQVAQCFGACEVLPPLVDDDHRLNTNFWLRTDLGVLLDVQNAWDFAPVSELVDRSDTALSDPKIAHQNCSHKYCTHMVDAGLYKCCVTAVLPMFLRQRGRAVPDLLAEYQAITAENISQENLEHLTRYIPQCALCPENAAESFITSGFKKPMILQQFQKNHRSVGRTLP